MLKQENTPRLETERLILRKFQHDDLEDVFRIDSDLEVNTFLPWFPLRSMDEARAYLAHTILPEYEKKIAYRYAIVEKTSQTMIGYVSLNGIDEGKCCADLGYGLRKEAWRKGYMSEACRAVLQRAKEAGFRFLTATHDVNNPASGEVMKAIGMTYRYSYDEQWQPKNFKVTFKLYQIDLISSDAN